MTENAADPAVFHMHMTEAVIVGPGADQEFMKAGEPSVRGIVQITVTQTGRMRQKNADTAGLFLLKWPAQAARAPRHLLLRARAGKDTALLRAHKDIKRIPGADAGAGTAG